MASTLGRGGRRRRVLNEEIVAASGTHAAYRTTSRAAGTAEKTPRYSEAASAKHHPRISDLIARRCRTIWIGWAVGLACTAGLIALDVYRDAIAHVAGAAVLSPLALTAPGNIASWFSSLVLLLAAAHAIYIYSLRRHRLNDYRGRYRVWLWAAAVLFLLSANSVIGFHAVAAAVATHLTGWSALHQDAVWWLVPSALLLSAIGYAVLRDAWESRLARFACLMSLSAFATGLVAFLSDAIGSGLSGEMAARIALSASLIGKVSLLAMLVAYARFVSLDAEGLLVAGESRTTSETPVTQKAVADPAATVKNSAATAAPRSSAVETKEQDQLRVRPRERGRSRDTDRRNTISTSEWVDGRTPVADDFENDDDHDADHRKLSKSERKRLRKIKSQTRRAA